MPRALWLLVALCLAQSAVSMSTEDLEYELLEAGEFGPDDEPADFADLGAITAPPGREQVTEGRRQLPTSSHLVVSASEYVRKRLNEDMGHACASKGSFSSVKVSSAQWQYADSPLIFLELLLTRGGVVETYHAKVAHFTRWYRKAHRFPETRQFQILGHHLSPNPCAYSPLVATFIETNAHNAGESSFKRQVYSKFVGKSHVDFRSRLGAIPPKLEDIPEENIDRLTNIDMETPIPLRFGVLYVPTPQFARLMEGLGDDSFSSLIPSLAPVYKDVLAINTIQDQGECASCYAHAAAVTYSSNLYFATKGKRNVLLSTQEIADCTNQCQGGDAHTVFEYMTTKPVPEAWCKPELSIKVREHKSSKNCGRQLCSKSLTWKTQPDGYKNAGYKIMATKALSASARVAAIQQHIREHGPVYVIMEMWDNFPTYRTGVYNTAKAKTKLGYHAVVLVGWGDDDAGNAFWVAQNSWGNSWGEAGFFRIRRGQNTAGIETIGVIYPVIKQTPDHDDNKCDPTQCKNSATVRSDCGCICQNKWIGSKCDMCPLKEVRPNHNNVALLQQQGWGKKWKKFKKKVKKGLKKLKKKVTKTLGKPLGKLKSAVKRAVKKVVSGVKKVVSGVKKLKKKGRGFFKKVFKSIGKVLKKVVKVVGKVVKAVAKAVVKVVKKIGRQFRTRVLTPLRTRVMREIEAMRRRILAGSRDSSIVDGPGGMLYNLDTCSELCDPDAGLDGPGCNISYAALGGPFAQPRKFEPNVEVEDVFQAYTKALGGSEEDAMDALMKLTPDAMISTLRQIIQTEVAKNWYIPSSASCYSKGKQIPFITYNHTKIVVGSKCWLMHASPDRMLKKTPQYTLRADSMAMVEGSELYYCGKEETYSRETNRFCTALTPVAWPESVMAKLVPGVYTVQCGMFLGKNEFGVGRGWSDFTNLQDPPQLFRVCGKDPAASLFKQRQEAAKRKARQSEPSEVEKERRQFKVRVEERSETRLTPCQCKKTRFRQAEQV